MSVHISAPIWVLPFTPASKKLVALYLADLADERGVCWPSITRIAVRCGISEGTAKAMVAELESEKWFTRTPRFRPNGSQTSSILVWDVQRLDRETRKSRTELAREAAAETSEEAVEATENGGVENHIPRGSENTPRGGARNIPLGGQKTPPLDPSVEPSVEPKRGTPTVPLAGDAPSRRRKLAVPPSPEAKEVVRVFAGIYGQRFGRVYVPDARQDGAAAAGLVAAGVTAEEVGRVFEAATRCKGWRASKTTTLPMLARFWNEVGAEIAQGANGNRSSDNGQTADEWADELRNLTTPMRGDR